MRVGIVGATAIERADGDIRPYGYSLVGAAVLSGPESPRRFAALGRKSSKCNT